MNTVTARSPNMVKPSKAEFSQPRRPAGGVQSTASPLRFAQPRTASRRIAPHRAASLRPACLAPASLQQHARRQRGDTQVARAEGGSVLWREERSCACEPGRLPAGSARACAVHAGGRRGHLRRACVRPSAQTRKKQTRFGPCQPEAGTSGHSRALKSARETARRHHSHSHVRCAYRPGGPLWGRYHR